MLSVELNNEWNHLPEGPIRAHLEQIADGSTQAVIAEQAKALLQGGGVVALTGAGVSTESGIPDYRSPEALKVPRKPIEGPQFVRSHATRQRYWARAMVGWERFRNAAPGPSHRALAELDHHARELGARDGALRAEPAGEGPRHPGRPGPVRDVGSVDGRSMHLDEHLTTHALHSARIQRLLA